MSSSRKENMKVDDSSRNEDAKNPHSRCHRFPFTLHRLLDEQTEQQGIIDQSSRSVGSLGIVSWVMNGTAFKIHDKERFVRQILPHYYETSNMKSFQRNLNLWNFKRVSRGAFKGIISHPLFLRGHPDLCHGMIRTQVKGNGKRRGTVNMRDDPEASSTIQPDANLVAVESAPLMDPPRVADTSSSSGGLMTYKNQDREIQLNVAPSLASNGDGGAGPSFFLSSQPNYHHLQDQEVASRLAVENTNNNNLNTNNINTGTLQLTLDILRAAFTPTNNQQNQALHERQSSLPQSVSYHQLQPTLPQAVTLHQLQPAFPPQGTFHQLQPALPQAVTLHQLQPAFPPQGTFHQLQPALPPQSTINNSTANQTNL